MTWNCLVKVSVAAVAKLLGAKWKALTDEEREQYKKRAAEQSADNKRQEQEAQPMEGTEPPEVTLHVRVCVGGGGGGGRSGKALLQECYVSSPSRWH